jgi:hypothetical protein
MEIAALDLLIGTWTTTGRSAGSDHDDITGELSATSVLGGRMLQLLGSMHVGGTRIDSFELIWHDPDREDLPAHVYSGNGAPLDYRWDIDGNTLLHAGLGMTYTGVISADRSTITGSWRADPDRQDMIEANYDAVLRRIG